MHRLLLSAAVWLGLSAAAWVNQMAVTDSVPPAWWTGASAIVWGLHGAASFLVLFLLAPPELLPDRLSRTAQTWLALGLCVWLSAAAILVLKIAQPVLFFPALLVSVAMLPLLRLRRRRVAWPAGVVPALGAVLALVFPAAGIGIVAGACAVLLLIARGLRDY